MERARETRPKRPIPGRGKPRMSTETEVRPQNRTFVVFGQPNGGVRPVVIRS